MLIVRSEVCVPPERSETWVGLKVMVIPEAGAGEAVRVTTPENPLTLPRDIVEPPEDPGLRGEGETGPAVTEKSLTAPTVTVKVIVFE